MATAGHSTSAAVRARLSHPVIDSDGHMIEFEPGFLDYLTKVGGRAMVDLYQSTARNTGSWGKLFDWYRLSPEERRAQHATRSPWWALPTKNTLDRATAVLPKLLHGDPMVRANLGDLRQTLGSLAGSKEDPAALDDWARCGIEKAEDIKNLFVPNFYFGCEADDPLNATAFNSKANPFGARLGAIFSSDIGHWDVPDMTEVLEEAYELVEHGIITEVDFQDFVFTNPAKMWAGMNPDFFKGTVVEKDVANLMTRASHS